MADYIDGVYAINEYMAAALTTASLDHGKLYPGVYAPPTENSSRFMLYGVRANKMYDLKAMNVVYITYTMYNSDFDNLQRISAVIGKTFDVENIQYTSLAESGVHFKETTITFTGDGEAQFLDGINYFLQHFVIKAQFTLG